MVTSLGFGDDISSKSTLVAPTGASLDEYIRENRGQIKVQDRAHGAIAEGS